MLIDASDAQVVVSILSMRTDVRRPRSWTPDNNYDGILTVPWTGKSKDWQDVHGMCMDDRDLLVAYSCGTEYREVGECLAQATAVCKVVISPLLTPHHLSTSIWSISVPRSKIIF
jgi:hypothetical protein